MIFTFFFGDILCLILIGEIDLILIFPFILDNLTCINFSINLLSASQILFNGEINDCFCCLGSGLNASFLSLFQTLNLGLTDELCEFESAVRSVYFLFFCFESLKHDDSFLLWKVSLLFCNTYPELVWNIKSFIMLFKY